MIVKPVLSRRQLLQWSGFSGASLLLGGCATSLFSEQVGQAFEPLNQSLQALLLSQKPVPEFPISAIEPDKLLINTFDATPQIDPLQFRLQIQGEVDHPMQLSLTDLKAMPLASQWGGVRLQDLIRLAQPKSNVRYVYFKSADGYYESWDLASAVHPQTLMAYQKNGAPLSIENGAPLRLASPVKLGYKQSKWVTEITLLSQLMPMKGYWEDQGYEWFGGL